MRERATEYLAAECETASFSAAERKETYLASQFRCAGRSAHGMIDPVVRSLVSLVHCLDAWLFNTATEQMLGYAGRMSSRQFPLGTLQTTQVQLAAASVHNHSSFSMRQGDVEGCLHGGTCSIATCPSVESSGLRKGAGAPAMQFVIGSIGTCPAEELIHVRNFVNSINCRNSKILKMSQEPSANYTKFVNAENKEFGTSEDARDKCAGAELADGHART